MSETPGGRTGAWPRPSRFRAALTEGAVPPVAMWLTLQSTNLVELAAAHGLDTVIIDQEHTTSGLELVQHQILAAQLAGMTALVRPPAIDPHHISRILDAGAEGIVFPRVSNVHDARTAAASLRYPPRGTRGWAGNHARHVRWNSALTGPGGQGVWSPEFVAATDESIASVFMIEGPSGVEQLDDILEIGRPDGVIFGLGDFMLEVEFDQAKVADAKHRIHETCRKYEIGVALSLPLSADDQQQYYPGCFFSAGVDASIVSEAIRTRMDEARAAVARIHPAR